MLWTRTPLGGLAIATFVLGCALVVWKMLDYRSRAHAADELIAAYQELTAKNQALEREVSSATDFQRSIVTRLARITPEAPLSEIADALREYVYVTNRVGSGNNHRNNGALIFANLGQPGSEQFCGGMSTALAWGLNVAGIPARAVQLAAKSYLDGEREGDTHVTVEAWIDDDWRIVDPTFNTSFDCSDGTKHLSVSEARVCVDSGHELLPILGAAQLPNRTLADYYLPFDAFLAAWRRPAVSSVNDSGDEFPEAGWLQLAKKHYDKQ